jgi:alkylation response protein AidB-like acyl-CoA dehydrogenase
MDFDYTLEQEQFRSQVRAWLETTASELFGDLVDSSSATVESLLYSHDDQFWQKILAYHRRLHGAGYLALHWPKQWGGSEAGVVEQSIYQDEALRLGLPLYGANNFAIDRIGPTIMLLGSEEQKKRFLAPMLTGEEIWCQGYSEPNAGSDLAGLQTRAVLEGDSFVLNGQKVWTSNAHRAQYQVLLVRTDPAAPKHRGISYLLVDLRSPGITVRPLMQITGEMGFNEVFYDGVRVPRQNLVGKLNEGWQVSIATLMFQRASGGVSHPVERTVGELVTLAKTVAFDGMPASENPYVRQKLAQFAAEARCIRLGRYRAMSAQLNGRPPGPASSIGKLCATELNLRLAMFADEMLGLYANLESESIGTVECGKWTNRIIAARQFTIAGGTSEIQRNIIGERVLGLPKG